MKIILTEGKEKVKWLGTRVSREEGNRMLQFRKYKNKLNNKTMIRSRIVGGDFVEMCKE